MKLKNCTCKDHTGAHKIVTTKNVIRVERTEMGLWFTHVDCGSTLILRSKEFVRKLKARAQNETKP